MPTHRTSRKERWARYVALVEEADRIAAAKVSLAGRRRKIVMPSGRTFVTEAVARYLVVDDSLLLSAPRKVRHTDSLSTAILAAERTGSAKVWIVDTGTAVLDGVQVVPVRRRNGLKGSPWVTL